MCAKPCGLYREVSRLRRSIARFLRGETLPTEQRGWILVRVDGYGLGWGKGAAGVLKNHYPKGLRRG